MRNAASHSIRAEVLLQLKQYGRLMRLDKPIGFWLLLWPTLWALWLAGAGHPDQGLFIVFVLGVLVMGSHADDRYYVPEGSHWPVVGSAGLLFMFGFSLTRGIGVPVDYRLALKVLPGACALDPDDEACQTANAIAEEASNALGHTDDPLPQP